METWILVTIIIVPVVVLAILTASIGFLCMRHYRSKKVRNGTATNGDTANGVGCDVEGHGLTSSLDVESQRRTSSLDAESHEKTASNDKTETRSVNDNVSIINEKSVRHNDGIRVQSGKGVPQQYINANEETLRHIFITQRQTKRGNLPPAVATLEKTVHHNFEPGITTGRENLSSASIISVSGRSINKQSAAQRIDNGLSNRLSQQLNVSSKHKSTSAQNQKQARATHTTAVTHGTRYGQQFTREPRIYFDTLTGYRRLDLHYYSKNEAMAVFKTFLQDSITGYINSNYRKKMRFILVITGRGLHSRGGIPVIKIAVENYLYKHDYTYNWSNPGMARIDLLPFKVSFFDY